MRSKPPTSRGRRVAVQEREETRATQEPDGLWAIAMLRIAVELKRPGAPGLQHIIDGVVSRMGIEKAAFEKYLADNFGLLERQARDKGYVP